MLKRPIKIIAQVVSVITITLGLHGVWVYCSGLELLFGADGGKLFLEIDLPMRISELVSWMSGKGFQSWIIPAIFIVIGFLMWKWQSGIYVKKLKVAKWLWE